MERLKIFFVFVAIVLIMASCSPSSKITGTWKSPKVASPYHVVMVAGLTENMSAKSVVENDMAAALSTRGVEVSKSIEVFPKNFTSDISKEEMLRKVLQKGTEAIITVTLLDKETESRYIPGSYSYAPMVVNRGFLGYYSYWYPQVYTPSYYTQEKIYYIETNVYGTKSGELVWSAQSETYDPADLSGFSQELANLIANKLEKDKIIERKNVKIGRPDQNSASRKK